MELGKEGVTRTQVGDTGGRQRWLRRVREQGSHS